MTFDLSLSSSVVWSESVATVLHVSSVAVSMIMSLFVVISNMHCTNVSMIKKGYEERDKGGKKKKEGLKDMCCLG